MELPAHISAKIARADTGCWLWTASFDRANGYGKIWMPSVGAMRKAHRVIYELLVGPIPDGLTLDHLCLVTACVNPAHLEPVTMAENIRRKPRATACAKGHPFDAENAIIKRDGTRDCRICARVRMNAYLERRKAARLKECQP